MLPILILSVSDRSPSIWNKEEAKKQVYFNSTSYGTYFLPSERRKQTKLKNVEAKETGRL